MAGKIQSNGEVSVTIVGMRDFQKALAVLGGNLPASLIKHNVEAAKKIVEEGRSEASSRQEKKAAKSLRASRSASSVAVLLGNNGVYAFALGAEYGSLRYAQFKTWRGNQWKSWDSGVGYFLHPAIRTVGETVLDDYWDSIRVLRKKAFPD